MSLTNEDLLAISQLLDTRLKPLEDKTKSIELLLENDVLPRLQDVKEIKLSLENNILPRLQNIESCYTSTYRRYASGIDQLDALQADMDIVKKAVAEHSEKLQKIS